MTTTDVIVVGAGPSGLATACELAWRGVGVTVVDAASEPFRGSRGKGLQPRTLELLDRHGLAGRLMSLGRFQLSLRRWSTDEHGEPVYADHDMNPDARPSPASPYGRGLMIPQWRTESVLREHLAELGVSIRWNTRAAGLEQDDDGVTLAVEGAEPLTAHWVVGCDGGSSAVRHALGVSFLGETREDARMLLGDLVVEGVDRDRWHMWEYLGLCPLPATDTFCFQARDDDPSAPLTVETYQSVLDRAGAGHVRVREIRWSSRWRLNVRMVERYRVGRVFLAGDAAHVHSPAGGQGMNTGIGDGVNLGWKLAAVCAGADESLLDTYEAERLPIAAGVLGLSTALGGRRFEERGAEGMKSLQLDLGYRESRLAGVDDAGDPMASDSIVDGSGVDGPGTEASGADGSRVAADRPRPGDRAPDAPVRDGADRRIRLFELFRHPGWTLLGFGTTPPSLVGVRSVTIMPADGVLPAAGVPAADAALGADVGSDRAGAPHVAVRDHAGLAATAYAPRPGELVLVRPDGYLGLRTTEPDAVRRYLADLLPITDLAPAT